MKVTCPNCKQEALWENNPHRPFCSDRCRLLDLGNWASEKYRVPEEEEKGVTQLPGPKGSGHDSEE